MICSEYVRCLCVSTCDFRFTEIATCRAATMSYNNIQTCTSKKNIIMLGIDGIDNDFLIFFLLLLLLFFFFSPLYFFLLNTYWYPRNNINATCILLLCLKIVVVVVGWRVDGNSSLIIAFII